MSEPARLLPGVGSRANVRPLSRAAARPCARSGCPSPATATLVYQYQQQQGSLVGLTPEKRLENHDLCREHADRTTLPRGWTLTDKRPPDTAPPDKDDLGSAHTVAVLKAALRGTPSAEPAPEQDDDSFDDGLAVSLDGALAPSLDDGLAVSLDDRLAPSLDLGDQQLVLDQLADLSTLDDDEPSTGYLFDEMDTVDIAEVDDFPDTVAAPPVDHAAGGGPWTVPGAHRQA